MEVKSLLGLPEELEVVGGDVTEKMITITGTLLTADFSSNESNRALPV